MTPRDILLAFQAGTLSKHEVRAQLRAFHTPSRRYPLSEGQRGLWALHHIAPQSSTYNVPLCFRLGNALDVALWQRACDLLLERFPILTSVFGEENGVPFRTEQPLSTLGFAQEDLSALAADAVLPHLRARANQPFSLTTGPLIRLHLCSRATAAGVERFLLITIHHIIFDGASVVPLLTILFDAYRDLVAGRQPEPWRAAVPYADFVDWERRMLASEPGAEHLAYWSQQLDGPLPLLDLPTDRRSWEPDTTAADSASPQHLAAHTVSQRLAPELAAALRELASAQRLHMPVLFLGLFTLLLHRYSGQEEVIVGMPTIGRPQEEFDHEVGYFVNMLAIRVQTLGSRAWSDFLRELQLTVVDGLDHAAYPFPALVRTLNIPRHDEHHPVFQVAFVYQNFLRSGGVQDLLDRYRDTLAITLVADLHQESVYALTLEIFAQDGTFDLSLKYQPALYADAAVTAMLGHLLTLAAGIVRQPQSALDTYALLTPAEAAQLLRTTTGLPHADSGMAPHWTDVCLHEVFARQARATPDALAVTFDEQLLTYAELEARSTLLARYLQQHGVQAESLVGLSVQPSLDMMVGLLGILKAGGAYVPLDPSYPRERLAYMVRDSRVALILTQAAQAEQLVALAPNVRLIVLDREWSAVAQSASAETLPERQWAGHLAYVIYTSGSTGTPKGTLVQHNHVAHLFSCAERVLHFESTDVWTLFHSLSFDFSVWEMWGALLYGARLVLVSPTVSRSPREFYDLLARERVTVLNQIPSVFMQLIKVSQDATAPQHHLRYVLFGGEALAIPQLQPWFEHWGEASPQLINMYGITETTVTDTYHPVSQAETARDVSNIGKALSGIRLYILDRHGHSCPVGVPGEIYVGGQGVSRGYLRQPALTAQRFGANPFEPGTRLYKTGDLARWLPDATGQPGEIEYLGRLDEQVKVRGYRIELRKIEHQLRHHPAINDCVVVVQERRLQAGGETPAEHQSLIAYYLPSRPGAVATRQLRAHLQACLPVYMVPAAFVELETLPRTSSGKINRNALRQRPVVANGEGAGGPSDSALESHMLGIWQTVLGTEQIGVEDGFFDAGGDSVLLIAVADRIREELGVDLQVSTLFKYATVRTLSAHIAATRDIAPSVPVSSKYQSINSAV